MNNYDDIFNSQGFQNNNDRPFDKDEWAKNKQAERQAVYDLADSTAATVCADGEQFKAYLDLQTRFDRYSATNALLIMAQMPNATQINSFDGWKKAGASIKQNQKAFSIVMPGEQYKREDDSIGVSYNVRKVFDISQTTAASNSQPTVNMDERLLLKSLIHKPPVPIQMVDELPNGIGAYYDHSQQAIFVRRGMDATDIFRSVSQELAHAEIGAQNKDSYSREDAVFPAYCVSYMLSKKNGIDVSGYSFSNIPKSIRESDPKTQRAALSEIRDTAKSISDRMYRALEQNKEPKNKAQER